MICTITKVRKQEYIPFYLGKTIIIQSWFIEKQEIPRVNEVELIGISKKAMNFRIGNKEHWIPSSLITITERKEKPLFQVYGYKKR